MNEMNYHSTDKVDALLVMEEQCQLERRKVENLIHRERSYRINYDMTWVYNL